MRSTTGPDALVAGITGAVDAARCADPAAFSEAMAVVSGLDPEQVGIVAAAAVRTLVEQLHPDGLDADDVRAVLTRVGRASAWLPDIDVDAVLGVLGGALGMSGDPESDPAGPSRKAVAWHAPLVLADLSETAAARPSDVRKATQLVADHLAQAIGEIKRAETMELP